MPREFNFKGAKRGPRIDPKKTKVIKTIRLDYEVVVWLVGEADRRHVKYQTLINLLLREAMAAGADSLDRPVLRSEVDEIVSKAVAEFMKKKKARSS